MIFYATFSADDIRHIRPDVPVLLTASSFARFGLRRPALPEHIKTPAADSGGFVSTFRWGQYSTRQSNMSTAAKLEA